MGKKLAGFFLGFTLVALTAGCVNTTAVKKPSAPINKVAIVSFAVTNWGGLVSGATGDDRATELIDSPLSGLVSYTERKLSGFTRVSKASNFIGSAAYRNLGVKSDLDLLLPKVNGQYFVLFSKDNDKVITARLEPAVAKKLCSVLQVDAVVVVYSDWGVAMGRNVQTQRALAKTVVSVWDRSGNLVFTKRVDETGTGVLGARYSLVVNEGAIKQWSGAYVKAFDKIAVEMKAALKP